MLDSLTRSGLFGLGRRLVDCQSGKYDDVLIHLQVKKPKTGKKEKAAKSSKSAAAVTSGTPVPKGPPKAATVEEE